MTKIIVILFLSSFLMSTKIFANEGNINFVGSISEPACIIGNSAQQIELKCVRNGVERTSIVVLRTVKKDLPYPIGYFEVSDKTPHIKEVQINYN